MSTSTASLDAQRARLRWVVVGLAVALSVVMSVGWWVLIGYRAPDWQVFAQVPERLADGTLYAPPDYNWRWSPVAAWIMVPIVALGYWPFVAAHLAVVPLLSGRLAIATAISWPFIADALASNTIVFSVVAGAMALRGSRWAALVYLALFILIPRPLLIAVGVWLLWHDRWLWLPTVALVALHLVLVALSGYGGAYVATLLEATNDVQNFWNLSPTRWLGYAWMVVGVPLAVWLWLKGRVGLSSLALSPYLLPQYLLVAVWEFIPRRTHGNA